MSNINKAVSLTKYLVDLPPTSILLFLLLLLSLLFGLGLALITEVSVLESILTGIFILAIPGLLTIILAKAILSKVPTKRIVATTLAGALIYAITYLVAVSLTLLGLAIGLEFIFVGAAIAFIIWYLIARLVFVHKWRSLVFAILQLAIYAIFLMADGLFPISGDPLNVLLKFYLSSFVLLAGLYIFFLLINAPMKRTFGVASTDAVSMFFSQWFYDKNDIEKAFRKVGESVKTYLSVLIFRRKDGDFAFIVPAVHFGPFGNLGGSNFSYLIAEEMEKKHKLKSFVFHGTATHDLNPVSATELKKITSATSEVLSNAKPVAAKASFRASANDSAIAEILQFNGHGFIGLTRAPKTTEDMSLGMGMALASSAEKTIPTATIVDQHNAETGEIEYVEPGTKMGFDYLASVEEAAAKAQKSKKLKVGFSASATDSPKIGPAGIKVAVFGTDPQYVLILIDANGVTPIFRRKIMTAVETLFRNKNLGDVVVGVYTTDTHMVNTVKGVVNPLTDNQIILEQVTALAEDAFNDMAEAEFYSEKRLIDLRVLGAKQAIELVSTVNAIVAISKVAAPIIMVSGIIAILWIISRLGVD